MSDKQPMERDATQPIEVVLASEEAMRRNAQALVERYNRMNKEWNEMKKEVQDLKNMVHMQNQELAQMKQQTSLIQAQLYAKGTAN